MRKAILCSLFVAALAWPAAGQSNYGEISGSIRDSQHLPIVGATVQLTASGTHAIRRLVTNADGHFEASALLPDEYEVKTEASGFATSTEKVRLEVGQKMDLDIKLSLGAVKEERCRRQAKRCALPTPASAK